MPPLNVLCFYKLELDLCFDIIYQHTKFELNQCSLSKVIERTPNFDNERTDARTGVTPNAPPPFFEWRGHKNTEKQPISSAHSPRHPEAPLLRTRQTRRAYVAMYGCPGLQGSLSHVTLIVLSSRPVLAVTPVTTRHGAADKCWFV